MRGNPPGNAGARSQPRANKEVKQYVREEAYKGAAPRNLRIHDGQAGRSAQDLRNAHAAPARDQAGNLLHDQGSGAGRSQQIRRNT